MGQFPSCGRPSRRRLRRLLRMRIERDGRHRLTMIHSVFLLLYINQPAARLPRFAHGMIAALAKEANAPQPGVFLSGGPGSSPFVVPLAERGGSGAPEGAP